MGITGKPVRTRCGRATVSGKSFSATTGHVVLEKGRTTKGGKNPETTSQETYPKLI
jgi:hypothetical protein